MSGGANINRKNSNPNAWDKIENEKPSKAYVVRESAETDFEEVESENVSEIPNGDFEDFINGGAPSGEIDDSILSNEEYREDFADVLQLTEYTDDKLIPSKGGNYGIAEYTDIDVAEVSQKHRKTALNFVAKITDFILKFNDVQLTDEHKKYLKQVGALQVQHLEDLLYLVDVNKQMMNNIINRVNATQSEDYAILNSYNNLANQHLKLIKELQNTSRSIPSVMKKMKADIMCNQELLGEADDEEMDAENFGKSQFTNSKQMLRGILAKKNQKLSEGGEA